jgi:hypothetical protein
MKENPSMQNATLEPVFRSVVDPDDTDPFEGMDGAILAAMNDPRFDPYGEGTLPQPKKERKPYDPGKPNGITKTGPGTYEVISFRDPSLPPYQVNLAEGSCTCPDFLNRHRECKHQKLAWEQAGIEVWNQALYQPTEKIESLLDRLALHPIIRAELEDALRMKRDVTAPAMAA